MSFFNNIKCTDNKRDSHHFMSNVIRFLNIQYYFHSIVPNYSANHYFSPFILLRFTIPNVTNRKPKRYFWVLLAK